MSAMNNDNLAALFKQMSEDEQMCMHVTQVTNHVMKETLFGLDSHKVAHEEIDPFQARHVLLAMSYDVDFSNQITEMTKKLGDK